MMSTGPKSGEQHEIKHDSDGNTKHIQSIPPTPTKQEDNTAWEQAAQTSGEESAFTSTKKISWWKKILPILRSKGQISKDPKPKMQDASPTTTTLSSPAATQSDPLVHLIDADILHISKEAQGLQKYNTQLTNELAKLKILYEDIKKLPDEDREKQLNNFRKDLMKMKLTIPSKYKIGGEKKNDRDKSWGFISNAARSIEKMPQLHKRDVFETSMEFKDFEARYMKLEDRVKLCLLCFSIFPQEAIIKKRLMLQWWGVEGFASTEKEAVDNFEELMEKGFIQPVNDNRSLSVGSCRVHPFHRSALVALAERAKLFNFESGSGDPTQNFSGTFQACLMGAGLISYEDFEKKNKSEGGDPAKVISDLIQELEKLHLLMNVNEHILEFVDEWFSKMRNLNFLYLGRWKALATHHIEVEDPKFLKQLGNMKYVKFLSLQGVSNIISLPPSMLQLTNLDVLDLRACSNLESIPKEIGRLQMLTHLDMSECYLLANMPKSLSQLKQLKVLKGFFISCPADLQKLKTLDIDSRYKCTLADLQKLEKLEKLCIYTDWDDFPENQHVVDLEKLTSLIKLTITWGLIHKKESHDSAAEKKKRPLLPSPSPSPSPLSSPSPSPSPSTLSGKLPPKLKKLDLKCFPKPRTPDWLKLDNLKEIELKKLYIRGGQFRDLGQYQGSDDMLEDENKWKVEVLRLKYLGGIEMEWRQLQDLFPKLKYLENVSCPNLTLFPCDAKGVWINPN